MVTAIFKDDKRTQTSGNYRYEGHHSTTIPISQNKFHWNAPKVSVNYFRFIVEIEWNSQYIRAINVKLLSLLSEILFTFQNQ